MVLYYACNFLVIPSFILLSDIIFSTAHKAKGLEFDTVRVTDDYLPGTDLGMSIREYILWSNISRIIWFVEQEYECFKWLTLWRGLIFHHEKRCLNWFTNTLRYYGKQEEDWFKWFANTVRKFIKREECFIGFTNTVKKDSKYEMQPRLKLSWVTSASR